MTDRDVEQGSRRDEKAAGLHTPTGTPQRPASTRPLGRTGKRADPTEPEVPSAKRVREIRKQRSLLLIAAAILVLLSIVLFLLYKTGQQVTTLPAASAVAPVPLGTPARSTFESPNAREAPPRAMPAAAAPVTTATSLGAPSAGEVRPHTEPSAGEVRPHTEPSAPRPKASAPTTDIFRKPAF
jgi:hypothetical protein